MDTRPMTAPRSAVRRLATARIISITGGAAAYTALNFTILQETGSAAWVAISLLLFFAGVWIFRASEDAFADVI